MIKLIIGILLVVLLVSIANAEEIIVSPKIKIPSELDKNTVDIEQPNSILQMSKEFWLLLTPPSETNVQQSTGNNDLDDARRRLEQIKCRRTGKCK